MGQKTLGARTKAAFWNLQMICKQNIENAIHRNCRYEFCEPYYDSKYIADPELFKLGKWVEKNRGDLIYLELFVFEVRFVRYVLERSQEEGFIEWFQTYNHKPVEWSKIKNIGSISKSRGTGFASHPVSRLVDDLEKFRKNSKILKRKFEDISSLSDKNLPDKIEDDFIKTLYFRGCLEAAMWFPENVEGRQFELDLKNYFKDEDVLLSFDLNNDMGFYKNKSLGFSIDVFRNYHRNYRFKPPAERKSDTEYLPKKRTLLDNTENPSAHGVFVDPALWKNYYKTNDDFYRQPGRPIEEEPTYAEKETVLDWKELWAVNGRDRRFRPVSAIINYLSWQLFLQSIDDGRGIPKMNSGELSGTESYLAQMIKQYE